MRADILSRRPSPPLQVDAQIPLTEGGEVDHTKSEGFKKAKATLSPAFSSAVTEYVVDVPAGTTHVNVMATSFSGASVKIADVPGNMCCVDIRGGVSAVPITLELNGAVAATYVLRPNVTADTAADARVVMHEKPPVAPEDAPAHVHMHGGVPCTADHGEDGEDGHGHSHKHGHSPTGKTSATRITDTVTSTVTLTTEVRRNATRITDTVTERRRKSMATATATATERRRKSTATATATEILSEI